MYILRIRGYNIAVVLKERIEKHSKVGVNSIEYQLSSSFMTCYDEIDIIVVYKKLIHLTDTVLKPNSFGFRTFRTNCIQKILFRLLWEM